jgi:hypothetical protein
MPATPAAKKFHRRYEQLLRDATIPKIRMNRERAEKSEAAPIRCEVRADQFSFALGHKRRGRIGLPTRKGTVTVSHKAHRVGQVQKRAEG